MSRSAAIPRKVFVSFAPEDLVQVDPIVTSTRFSSVFFNDQERKYIRTGGTEHALSAIADRILQTSVTICFLGAFTYTSSWVEWELEATKLHAHPIIAMGLKDGPSRISLPYGLLGQPWHGWDYRKLCRMIRDS
jgi:hypothetical protein